MSNDAPKLTTEENSLIDETSPHALEKLDAEALKGLQNRLRKARDKYLSLERRRGAARVEAQGDRLPGDDRSGEKVQVFDEALARLEERLDVVGE